MSPDKGAVERFLARDRLIVLAALAAATLLAWAWLARPMGEALMTAPWSASYLLATLLMWSLMMVAMMLPSASPMILLYARFARTRFGSDAGRGIAVFVLAYVLVWTGFSALAALLQAALADSGVIGRMGLVVGDARIAGALLVAAGLYQLTPLKSACLDACRSPLAFLAGGIRPGAPAALRLGLRHGLFCVGCCWALMLLLFAGGVMNLAWVAGLALIVMAEKLVPWPAIRLVIAAGLLLGGCLLLFSPSD